MQKSLSVRMRCLDEQNNNGNEVGKMNNMATIANYSVVIKAITQKIIPNHSNKCVNNTEKTIWKIMMEIRLN